MVVMAGQGIERQGHDPSHSVSWISATMLAGIDNARRSRPTSALGAGLLETRASPSQEALSASTRTGAAVRP